MRQKIGLVVELPRHGPGVKEDMIGIEERLLEPARVSLKGFFQHLRSFRVYDKIWQFFFIADLLLDIRTYEVHSFGTHFSPLSFQCSCQLIYTIDKQISNVFDHINYNTYHNKYI